MSGLLLRYFKILFPSITTPHSGKTLLPNMIPNSTPQFNHLMVIVPQIVEEFPTIDRKKYTS
jgi:hypothetical protein